MLLQAQMGNEGVTLPFATSALEGDGGCWPHSLAVHYHSKDPIPRKQEVG